MSNTVTLSLEEYNGLRDFKREVIEKGSIPACMDNDRNTYFFTSDEAVVAIGKLNASLKSKVVVLNEAIRKQKEKIFEQEVRIRDMDAVIKNLLEPFCYKTPEKKPWWKF